AGAITEDAVVRLSAGPVAGGVGGRSRRRREGAVLRDRREAGEAARESLESRSATASTGRSEGGGMGAISGPPSLTPLPESAQRAAVDLAVGVIGDRVDDDDGGRHLERHEGGAAVLEQRRLRRTQPWSDYDEAHRHFSVDLVAYANGRGVRHVGMLEQAVRQLQRR